MAAMGGAYPKGVVTCDSCGATRARRSFDPEDCILWDSKSKDTIQCKTCKGSRVGNVHDAYSVVYCNGECQKEVPEFYFVEESLIQWKETGLLIEARCARCVVKEMPWDGSCKYKCQACDAEKHISLFAPVAVKDQKAAPWVAMIVSEVSIYNSRRASWPQPPPQQFHFRRCAFEPLGVCSHWFQKGRKCVVMFRGLPAPFSCAGVAARSSKSPQVEVLRLLAPSLLPMR